MHSLIFLLAILIISPSTFSDTAPLVVPWNKTHSYGPDGPWSVVTVQVGSSDIAGTQPLSTINLHPGGIYESMLLRGFFCNDNDTNYGDGTSECLAKKAGLYNLSQSETAQQNITDAPGLVWQWSSSAAEDVSGLAANVLDTMRIPSLDGTFTVHNSTISAVRAWQIRLPDGTRYSTQVGTLSLGAPGTGIQQFDGSIIGQTVPGYAYEQGAIPSNSWGLHYGSASLNQEGSLVFGGYDQSRVLGEVGVFGIDMNPNLLDIQIGVENGSSPFSERSYTGLLKLNASFNGVQPARINPILPYLFMSPETCAAIAKNLPVELNGQVGLYIWNTTDPQYERIVKSPAYLALVFQKAEGGNLTIKVSFQLLNLTLQPPIVATTQQYFPCRPFHASDESGDYFLGKAFLQAAFIGMNWQQEKFFLAQAPGPGVGASNIKPIGPNDASIDADPIEKFAMTWARNWTALSDAKNSRNTTVLPTTHGPKDTPDTGSSKNRTAIPTIGQNGVSGSGLSSGTKAGIAVGAVVGALAMAVAGVVLSSYLKGRGMAAPAQERDVAQEQRSVPYEMDGRPQDLEFGEGLPHEADADREVYELQAREEL